MRSGTQNGHSAFTNGPSWEERSEPYSVRHFLKVYHVPCIGYPCLCLHYANWWLLEDLQGPCVFCILSCHRHKSYSPDSSLLIHNTFTFFPTSISYLHGLWVMSSCGCAGDNRKNDGISSRFCTKHDQ